MLTGATAAAELRLGLLAGEAIHAYVADHSLSTIKRRYRLQESDSPNVRLRVIPWTGEFGPSRRIAPKAAIALDLLEDEDPRAREVGKKLLHRLPG